VVTALLDEIWSGRCCCHVNAERAEHRQLHGFAEQGLQALADVRDNDGGAAEDHRCCGGAQQKTESGEKHQ
jgi:hypothetical protein